MTNFAPTWQNDKKQLFQPSNKLQNSIGRVIILADAAHAFGAKRNGEIVGKAIRCRFQESSAKSVLHLLLW